MAPRIPESQRRKIRLLAEKEGLSNGQLAIRFGISKKTVNQVINEGKERRKCGGLS